MMRVQHAWHSRQAYPVLVAAGQQQHGHAHNVVLRQLAGIWRVRLRKLGECKVNRHTPA